MSVPEAAVNEDYQLQLGKDEVRFSRKILSVKPVSKA
jgi:hypothetical protein